MSGNIPCFIRRDTYVLLNNELARVKDYHFTSSSTPYVPNTDSLVLTFEDGRHVVFAEDNNKVEAITKGRRPDFLEVGNAVMLRGDFVKGRVHRIKGLFYLTSTEAAARNPKEKDLVVSIEGFMPIPYKARKFIAAPPKSEL